MMLFTKAQERLLLANGRRSAEREDHDPFPVIKLFTPDGSATWLLSELDPEDNDLAFGLCDLGMGFPELGSVRISELQSVRGKLGLPVERDRYFKGTKPLSEYAEDARRDNRIAV